VQLYCLLALLGQVGSGALTGMVRDPAGAAVPGAAVVVTEPATNATRILIATADGVYTAAGLPPGLYRVEVDVAGFRAVRQEGIRLATGETVRLDIDLTIGGVQERVAVRGDAPILRGERAGLGRVVDHDTMVGLPLNGRSFITLASLAPGVALPPNSQLPRINGGRPRTNEYLFDGISVLQPEPGQVAFFPVIDAIQEFKIESNSPPAEFGRFNGGVVNLTTRAGSNRVQGSAFEFARHQSLNARNMFASTDPVKPQYRRHQFGAVLGGPIVPDHTFFFVDYQGQRQTIGRTVTSTVPTLLQREGIFTEPIAGRVPAIYDPASTAATADGRSIRTPFANNVIPVSRMDPVAVSLLQRYPLPTAAGTASNYRRTAAETDDQDQFDLRLDHRWAAYADHAFARLSYFNGRFVPVTPLPDGSGVGARHPLSARVLRPLVERASCRRYEAERRPHGRAVACACLREPEPPGHSLNRAVSGDAADVPHRRLSATWLARRHRVGLQHRCDRGGRLADVAERPAHREDRTRLALGAAQRDPTPLADWGG
jgi:carboxypeptidase family protein